MQDLFYDDLIFIDKNIKNHEEFFDFIYPILRQKKYVKKSFIESIKIRESNYPTGLPLENCCIAIPHTDTDQINQPFISVTRVQETASWREMANNDSILSVKFIFLLGFNEKSGHVDLLQKLITSFVNEQFIKNLLIAKHSQDFLEILNRNIIL